MYIEETEYSVREYMQALAAAFEKAKQAFDEMMEYVAEPVEDADTDDLELSSKSGFDSSCSWPLGSRLDVVPWYTSGFQ